MKRIVTQQESLRFTYFSVAILFCMLTFNGIHLKANTHAISTSDEFSTAYFNDETSDINSLNNSVISKEKASILPPIITPDVATKIKLTTATIGATILPALSTVIDRGIVWSTTTGVTIVDNKISEGGTIGGAFTVDIAGFSRSNTIYYKGYYTTIADGTVLSAESSFSNVPIFQGTGNWDDASKWNVLEVPGIISGDSPIIDGIATIANNSSNGNWICDYLTINASAKLTINTAQVLNIKNILINNAGPTGLIIKSDATLTNGTLTYQFGAPSATVEMYSKASWDLNQASGSRYSWQFFGIPVKTMIFSNYFINSQVRKFNEGSLDDVGLWSAQSDDAPLTAGTGYELTQHAPIKYAFTGLLTNEDINQTLEYTSGARYPGQHVLGNPYTAAIDIKGIVFGANTEAAIYLYNTGTYNQWLDNGTNPYTGTTSAQGQYTVSTPLTAGILGVPAQIPSMQGFIVNAMNQLNGSISIPYSTSVMNNTEMQRAPKKSKAVTPTKVATRVDLSGSHYADCMWIFSDPGCTANFDNGMDGFKMMGSMQTPQLYAMETGGNYQIDAVADMNGTYLGFNAGNDTNFKLTFTHLNLDVRYTGVYLVDLLTNTTTDITLSGTEYAFSAVSTPSPIKRFKIVTGTKVDTSTPSVSSLVKVFNSSGTLVIQNRSNVPGELTLYSMHGVPVKSFAYKANDITAFSTTNIVPGAYVAKTCTNKEMVTERIIIR